MKKKKKESKEESCVDRYCATEEIKKKLTIRLNRIEGQIRGIKNMIDEDIHCDDILNQISSVRAALAGVSKKVLENHLKHCVVTGIKDGNEEQVIEELIGTLNKMMR